MKDTKDKKNNPIRFGKYDLNFILNVISAQMLNKELNEDGTNNATPTQPLHDRQDIERGGKRES